jgi:membrane-bound lytic murein transglycosylase D
LAAELMRANKSYAPAVGVMVADTGVAEPAPPPPPEKKKKSSKRSHDYRVRPGDSLLAIAREHSCDLTVLAKANRLKAPGYMIKPNQHLKLKGCEE